MKKIITSIFAIVLTVAAVSGVAYAVFSDDVAVTNIAFTTGNADLQFSDGSTGWKDSYNFPALLAENVYPGYNDYATFYVRNNSSSDISLALSTRLISATNDWGVLSPIARVSIRNEWGSAIVDYKNLTWWNAGERQLGVVLAQDVEKEMRIYLDVPTSADNSISNKKVTTGWVLYGTQI